MKETLHKKAVKQLANLLLGKTENERILHRLHAVVLVLYGLSSSEVARIFDDSPRAVAYWVTQFKRDGIIGLKEESRPGRPAKLTPSQQNTLQTFLDTSDKKSQNVNAQTLAQYIKEQFDVALTNRQCWRILRQWKNEKEFSS